MAVVLVDMDGPLAAFDAHFFAACEANGFAMHCTLETQCHRYATDCVIVPADRAAARRMVDNTRWFLDLPVTAGAVEGLNALADVADVWICTKPLEVNATCRDDKAAWVRRHFGHAWERRLIVTPDKSMVSGDFLVDDAPHPDWYERASWSPIIFEAPWNGAESKWDGLPRFTWETPDALYDWLP